MTLTDTTQYKNELKQLEDELALPETASSPAKLRTLTQRHSRLHALCDAAQELHMCQERITEAEELLQSADDDELHDLAQEQLAIEKERHPVLEKKLTRLLIPPDKNDTANTIMEIRAGTGGDEACLFAADLLRMYTRYAEQQGWRVDMMNTTYTGLDGIKEVTFSIDGANVFSRLKYEGGVHRVQRVPQTETSGRLHTSAASVAVLPESEDIDITLDPNELRIDVYRSSGPGGQSVNTTDSAVRITHVPTGVVVTCQDEKSQHKNKAKALRVLKARLQEKADLEAQEERGAQRRSMIRSGDRSEKIRTYNFPQNRVTDHRVNLTIHALEDILNGSLDQVIDPLIEHDTEEQLKHIRKNNVA